MAQMPDLNVVCKNCGNEVSPYITECPYCGNRLRKRAPKIERDGTVSEPRKARKARKPSAPRLSRFTGVLAACLVALYIAIESPLSGMSMNPARSFAPAVASRTLATLWIYFVAPLAGMLLAAELYVRRHGHAAVRCAKLQHGSGACHFHCLFTARPS